MTNIVTIIIVLAALSLLPIYFPGGGWGAYPLPVLILFGVVAVVCFRRKSRRDGEV